jgi:hypothetical protein
MTDHHEDHLEEERIAEDEVFEALCVIRTPRPQRGEVVEAQRDNLRADVLEAMAGKGWFARGGQEGEFMLTSTGLTELGRRNMGRKPITRR